MSFQKDIENKIEENQDFEIFADKEIEELFEIDNGSIVDVSWLKKEENISLDFGNIVLKEKGDIILNEENTDFHKGSIEKYLEEEMSKIENNCDENSSSIDNLNDISLKLKEKEHNFEGDFINSDKVDEHVQAKGDFINILDTKEPQSIEHNNKSSSFVGIGKMDIIDYKDILENSNKDRLKKSDKLFDSSSINENNNLTEDSFTDLCESLQNVKENNGEVSIKTDILDKEYSLNFNKSSKINQDSIIKENIIKKEDSDNILTCDLLKVESLVLDKDIKTSLNHEDNLIKDSINFKEENIAALEKAISEDINEPETIYKLDSVMFSEDKIQSTEAAVVSENKDNIISDETQINVNIQPTNYEKQSIITNDDCDKDENAYIQRKDVIVIKNELETIDKSSINIGQLNKDDMNCITNSGKYLVDSVDNYIKEYTHLDNKPDKVVFSEDKIESIEVDVGSENKDNIISAETQISVNIHQTNYEKQNIITNKECEKEKNVYIQIKGKDLIVQLGSSVISRSKCLTSVIQILFSCHEFREKIVEFHTSEAITKFIEEDHSEKIMEDLLFVINFCRLFFDMVHKKNSIAVKDFKDFNEGDSLLECYESILKKVNTIIRKDTIILIEHDDEDDIAYKSFKTLNNSFVFDLFYGQIKNHLYCQNCSYIEKQNPEIINSLQLEIHGNGGDIDIQQSIDNYFLDKIQIKSVSKNKKCCGNSKILSKKIFTHTPKYIFLNLLIKDKMSFMTSKFNTLLPYGYLLPDKRGFVLYSFKALIAKKHGLYSVKCLYDQWYDIFDRREPSITKTLLSTNTVALLMEKVD